MLYLGLFLGKVAIATRFWSLGLGFEPRRLKCEILATGDPSDTDHKGVMGALIWGYTGSIWRKAQMVMMMRRMVRVRAWYAPLIT